MSFGRSWCTVPLRHKVQIPIKPLTPAGSNLACCGSHISVSCPVPGDIPSPFFSSAIRPDRIACSVRLMPTLIKTERKKKGEKEFGYVHPSVTGPFQPPTPSQSLLTAFISQFLCFIFRTPEVLLPGGINAFDMTRSISPRQFCTVSVILSPTSSCPNQSSLPPSQHATCPCCMTSRSLAYRSFLIYIFI